MNTPREIHHLRHLAHLYGIQTTYYDVHHHLQTATVGSLLAVLKSLGTNITSIEDAPDACREKLLDLWRRPLEPVIIAWEGKLPNLRLRLPADKAEISFTASIQHEDDTYRQWRINSADMSTINFCEVSGEKFLVKQCALPGTLRWGYHHLQLELPHQHQESLIISTPVQAYVPPATAENRSWGAFLPLYALHTKRSWGGGDFSDLGEMADWISRLGGKVSATLPLLPAFFGDFLEISPYRPISRLFWNEFFLDIEKVPELADCTTARELLSAAPFQNQIQNLKSLPVVDFQRQMILKQRVLAELANYFFSHESSRVEEYRHFAGENPAAANYAKFLGTMEKRQTTWHSWPEPLREGNLQPGDYDETDFNYHLYTQWLAAQQISETADKIKASGSSLYLDLPLGVHPDGYDTWHQSSSFISDITTGAPPDAVFTRGQNWKFPPLHPANIRENHYQYVIAYLRHNLKHAGILRIDHVMGFHRLFCIPQGMPNHQGVYLRYRPEEFYAILSLESHKHKTMLVGEDLGMVPWYVRPAMNKHSLQRMYILRFELASGHSNKIHPPPADSIASLNTHDMFPFAAFWQGIDIQQRESLGLINAKDAENERKSLDHIRHLLNAFLTNNGWLKQAEENDTLAVLKACLSFLGKSEAHIVLVNLEDLWLETKPQNIPSTDKEYPNWQQRAKYSLEEIKRNPQVISVLQTLNELRK
jgi:4-alpha-glucanotransferase